MTGRRIVSRTALTSSGGIQVSQVRVVAGSPQEQRTGLLGWLSFVVNDGLCVDGVTLRRTVEGELALSFPARRDAAGHQHFYLRPLSDQVRQDIQHQVLAAIGVAGSQAS